MSRSGLRFGPKSRRLLTDRLLEESAAGLTLGQAIKAVDTLSTEATPAAAALLADYVVHLRERLARVTQYRSEYLAAS